MKPASILVALTLLVTVAAAHAGGARLHHVGPNSVYAQVGLQSGDIIKAIDGETVTSNGHAAALLYGKANDGEEHTIEVMRDEELIEIVFPE